MFKRASVSALETLFGFCFCFSGDSGVFLDNPCFSSQAICEDPGSSPNLLKISDAAYRENTVVSYECNVGYQLTGATALTCFSTGWSAPKPQCVPRTRTYLHSLLCSETTSLETEFAVHKGISLNRWHPSSQLEFSSREDTLVTVFLVAHCAHASLLLLKSNSSIQRKNMPSVFVSCGYVCRSPSKYAIPEPLGDNLLVHFRGGLLLPAWGTKCN